MPTILEVGLACKELHISLYEMGFDVSNPRIVRDVQMAVSIYELAAERKRLKRAQKNAPKDKKHKVESWEKQNPEGAKLLRWAAGQTIPEGKDEIVTKSGEMLASVEIPRMREG